MEKVARLCSTLGDITLYDEIQNRVDRATGLVRLMGAVDPQALSSYCQQEDLSRVSEVLCDELDAIRNTVAAWHNPTTNPTA